jgi:hypothetical protein
METALQDSNDILQSSSSNPDLELDLPHQASLSAASPSLDEDQEHDLEKSSVLASPAAGVIPSHHRKLIHQILHRTALVRTHSSGAAMKLYRIVELEYYYSSPDHPDPYVHLDPHQSHWMCWYFHRQNGKSYKGGTYKGLDISIGDIGSPIDSTGESEGATAKGRKKRAAGAGGLLIRSILNIETGEVIQGPCKVVNELLLNSSSSSSPLTVHELVTELQNSALLDANVLPVPIASQDRLTFQRIKSNGQKILCSPRVGLTFRRVTPLLGKEYLMAPYRYTYAQIDFKANKSLLTILGLNLNLNKRSTQRQQKSSKSSSFLKSFSSSAAAAVTSSSTKSSAEWMRNYQEGVRHRIEDNSQDEEASLPAAVGNSSAFQRRMAKYCQTDWKVSELCYLYGYLIHTNMIEEMVDYDVERGISDNEDEEEKEE